MNETINSDVITGLVVACVCLFVFAIFASVFAWKKNKQNQETSKAFKQKQNELEDVLKDVEEKIKQQGATLDLQGQELGKSNNYNKAMGQIMLEEQKAYLYAVACTLDSYVRKNELQIKNGFISGEIGKMRNAQLLILKGNLLQYADALTSAQNEQTKISD